MFNKYQFLSVIKGELYESIENGTITEDCQIYDYVSEEIERECIYYSDCFDIVKDCGFVDWSVSDYEINGISSAAYAALTEFVAKEIDYNKFEELIKEKQENE
jgi:hypothetical protein